MKISTLKACPVCGKDLIISKLKCTECDVEYSGSFQAFAFANLNEEEIEFIKAFLKNEGNMSKIQKESGKTYASIKNILSTINAKLKLTKEKRGDFDMKALTQSSDSQVIKAIKDKLLACNGRATMPMLRGKDLEIWVASSGTGIENSGFPALVCEWNILEAIVNKANELGGTMYRGDSAAQNGAKIGSAELPLDTIDAFVSLEFYNAQIGGSTLRRSTYYAAILAWAGIVDNYRSAGKGGYIVVKPAFKK